MESVSNMYSTGLEFREFFVEELRDIYWAEKHLQTALRRIASATTDEELSDAFTRQAAYSARHMSALEAVFAMFDEKPLMKRSVAMEGLIREAESVVESTGRDTFTRDAASILAVQRAVHYCIATYATLSIYAGHMGEEGIRRELEETLIDYKQADVKLTEIAENYINALAAAE